MRSAAVGHREICEHVAANHGLRNCIPGISACMFCTFASIETVLAAANTINRSLHRSGLFCVKLCLQQPLKSPLHALLVALAGVPARISNMFAELSYGRGLKGDCFYDRGLQVLTHSDSMLCSFTLGGWGYHRNSRCTPLRA